MNRKIDQSLNTDERGCYEASLIGPDSDKQCLPCVVSGNYLLLNFLYDKLKKVFGICFILL